MTKTINIDSRLKSISETVSGSVVADVGSDHAYLPVWLWQNNKIKKAYAIDISAKSINKIKRTLKRYNISEDIIIPVLSDGLLNEAVNINEITDIIIAGMGGENISQIIGNINPQAIQANNINFILQPNSKVEFLRRFLYCNGFDITNEKIAEDENRLYNIIAAKLTGSIYNPEFADITDIIIGKHIKHEGYINKIIKRLQNILAELDGKEAEKYNIKTEFGYYTDIENLIKNIGEKKS